MIGKITSKENEHDEIIIYLEEKDKELFEQDYGDFNFFLIKEINEHSMTTIDSSLKALYHYQTKCSIYMNCENKFIIQVPENIFKVALHNNEGWYGYVKNYKLILKYSLFFKSEYIELKQQFEEFQE